MKKISEVCKTVGVSKRTLQYYDDEEVFSVERSENNYRLYGQEELDRIWQVMIFKEMGFTLKDIKQILVLPDNMRKKCLRQRMEEIETNIRKLNMQKGFILLVHKNGIPVPPSEETGVTYADSIKTMRKKLSFENIELNTIQEAGGNPR